MSLQHEVRDEHEKLGLARYIAFKTTDEKELMRFVNHNADFGYEVVEIITRANGSFAWISCDMTVIMELKPK